MNDATMAPQAGDDLQSTPAPERDDTFFLPAAATQGKEYKPGDTVQFKVVGMDKDGNVEVESVEGDAGDESSGSWQDEMRKNVPPSGPTS